MPTTPDIAFPNPEKSTETILKSLPAAIISCDKESNITFFNDVAIKLCRFTPELHKPYSSFRATFKVSMLDGTIIPENESPILLSLKTGKPFQNLMVWIERQDHSRFIASINVNPIIDDKGNIAGVTTIFHDISDFANNLDNTDITERKLADGIVHNYTEALIKANEALRKSEERYHRMIDEVKDYAILMLDKDGIIQNWNKGAENIKGYAAHEVIGKSFSLFYTAEDQQTNLPFQLLDEARANERAIHEGWRVRKDGTKFWGSVVITALHDNDHNITGFTKVTRDLTERKLYQDSVIATALQLEEKNKDLQRANEELASFAYVSSHDLQEPLRKIQTFTDYLLTHEKTNLSQSGKEYLNKIFSGAVRMQNLIRDILTYSRNTATDHNFEFTDLNALVDNILSELDNTIEEKKATFQVDALPKVWSIPYQLQQLFTNIINNALKFTKPNTPPVIRISSATVKGASTGSPLIDANQLFHCITIQDNGIGFEPKYKQKIFEVFQRLHAKNEFSGTGIGLAICKKIVDNHKGYITAESQPGQGASFNIYLPVV